MPATSPAIDPTYAPRSKDPARALALRAAHIALLEAPRPDVVGAEEARATLIFRTIMHAVEDWYLYHDSASAILRAQARDALWFILEGRAPDPGRFGELLAHLGCHEPQRFADHLISIFRWMVRLQPGEARRLMGEVQEALDRERHGLDDRPDPWLVHQWQTQSHCRWRQRRWDDESPYW